MRRTRMLWLCFLVCLFAGLAHGSSLPGDPQVQIDDPSCTPTTANTQTITAGQIDTFNTSNGTCFGFNIDPSSAAFSTIDLQVDASIDISTINCISPQYTCSKSNLGAVTDMFFTANTTECGDGAICSEAYTGQTPFVVDLFTPEAFGPPWASGLEFAIRGGSSTAVPADNPNLFQQVPEPSTFLLLGTGAAAIAARRKLLKVRNG